MLKDKFIICYSGTNWGLPWGICQRLMERFSRFNKILFVEYQPSFLHCHLNRFSHKKYSSEERGLFKDVNNDLRTYLPEAGLPFNNYLRILNVLNQNKISKEIRPQIEKFDPKKIIIWAFVPYAIDFVNNLNKFFTIYHCGGNYAYEKKNFLRTQNILQMEQEIAGRSNLIIGQAKSLCEKFDALNKKTFYLPSAINADYFFKTAEEHETAEMAEFAGIKHPRIGLIGYFDDDFYDTGLLNHLLDKRKDWSFVFIGPVTDKAKNFNRLKNKKNVFFLGHKDPKVIPYYINKVDVGIIPYKVNDYTKAVSPTKFYEYLACGKPVVSTELPDIKGYRDVLKTAGNKYEFLKEIERFLSGEAKDAVREKALMIARENSFDKYFDNLSETIERAMNESV
jgi:glycosyltransferase involved in cell wall biosynthesis